MNPDASATHWSPRWLAAAPHRLMFFVGAANVLAAMTWWALWLCHARFGFPALAEPPIYAGWIHAFVMPYGVFAPFMFGFLLTVFPRWMGQPEMGRWHYVPVGFCLISGQVLLLVGAFGHTLPMLLGLIHTAVGWVTGIVFLAIRLHDDRFRTGHAISALAALLLGCIGIVLFVAHLLGADPRVAQAALQFGTFGLMLPMYATVAHRMFPFFAGVVVPGYRAWRPMEWLTAAWVFALLHLGANLIHAESWRWLADAPFAAIATYWLWRNAPRGPAPPLLRVLFIGFAWLPIAMTLFTIQSIRFALGGSDVLGLAPVHALLIGFFGSLLVAMVTRVTHGHSGRPLMLGRTAAFAFVAIQIVAVVRIVATLSPDPMSGYVLAAFGWLLAFVPWVVRSLGIYLTPRADGRPG